MMRIRVGIWNLILIICTTNASCLIMYDIIMKDLNDKFNVFQSHKDIVTQIPPNFDIIGIDKKNNIQIL